MCRYIEMWRNLNKDIYTIADELWAEFTGGPKLNKHVFRIANMFKHTDNRIHFATIEYITVDSDDRETVYELREKLARELLSISIEWGKDVFNLATQLSHLIGTERSKIESSLADIETIMAEDISR